MATFYFDLVGDLAASDVFGLECPSVQAARQHARQVAHRTATENPQLVREGNYVSVRNARGFIAARLHRSVDGKKVAMYAKWQSAKAYQAMRESSASHSYLEQALAIAKFQSDIYEIVETFTPSREGR